MSLFSFLKPIIGEVTLKQFTDKERARIVRAVEAVLYALGFLFVAIAITLVFK